MVSLSPFCGGLGFFFGYLVGLCGRIPHWESKMDTLMIFVAVISILVTLFREEIRDIFKKR